MRNKILLFLSSYIPLYILLIGKNILERVTAEGIFINIPQKFKCAKWFDSVNDYALIVLLAITIISFVYLLQALRRSSGSKVYVVKSVEDQTGELFFSYISVYLISCMGLSLNRIVDCFVFLFLMIIIGIIYVKNGLQYINPVMNILGYKVYHCLLDSENTSDKDIDSIVVVQKDTDVRVEERIIGTVKCDFIVCVRNEK